MLFGDISRLIRGRSAIWSLIVSGAILMAACSTLDNDPSLTGDYLSGRLAVKKNSIAEAASSFLAAHEDAPEQKDILRSAFFYQLAAGEINAAGPLAEKILTDDDSDNDGLARVTLAAIYLKRNDYMAARNVLEGGYDAPFLKSVAYLTDVWIEDALHGPKPAIAKLEIAPKEVFKGFNPLHKALLLEKADAIEEARTAHQVSVFGVGGPVGRAAYGAFLERVDDEASAREYYRLLNREAGSARRTAQAGMRRLDNRAASKLFQNATAQQGASIAFNAFSAAILEQTVSERTRAEEAGFNVGEPRYNLPLSLGQIAIYLNPDLHEARNLVGQIFNVYGDFDAAADTLHAIPPSSPLFEQSRIFIAGGVSARGEPEKAIAMLKDTISRDSGALEAKFSLANLHAAEGQHRESVSIMTEIIDGLAEDPEEDAWRYYISRGASLLELDRWKQGEADLKKAVALAPEEATALNYLGYSWAERGENLEEAFQLIEKAVELEPNSGAITDSLGWAHYQRGDYETAVGHLEMAASLEPSDPTITDHLGDVYWRLERPIEARYEWRRVLELDAPKKLEAQVKRKLEEGLEPANVSQSKK